MARCWINLAVLVVVFKWFIFAIEQPGLSSVQSISLHPGWKCLSLFVMGSFFVWIFVHREQSGQKASRWCSILCIQWWLFSHLRVHCWLRPMQRDQFIDKVSDQSFNSARSGRDGHGMALMHRCLENTRWIHSCSNRFEIIWMSGVLAPGMLLVSGR